MDSEEGPNPGQRDREAFSVNVGCPGSVRRPSGEDSMRLWSSVAEVAELLAQFVSLVGDDALQDLHSPLQIIQLPGRLGR